MYGVYSFHSILGGLRRYLKEVIYVSSLEVVRRNKVLYKQTTTKA
jgi:hypothetical protein